MIFSLIALGLLSSLALGPAGFNIVRKILRQPSWPWADIGGFILGDFLYIGLSLLLLQSPWLQNSSLRLILTLATSTILLVFSFHLIAKRGHKDVAASSKNGFWGSFLLALGNFHLVLIYTGLFAGLIHGGVNDLLIGAVAYSLSFVVGFLVLLQVLKTYQSVLKQLLRQIEMVVGFGFIFFSFYLSWGTL